MICQQILSSPVYQQSVSLAVYSAIRRECSLSALIKHAVAAGKQVYLPIVHGKSLKFARFTEQTHLQKNRFGIDEPVAVATLQTDRLNLVLAPLVAFDQNGNRLGMGGGYYDRTFAFLAKCARPAALKLVGVAFEFQRTELPNPRPWDIPLDAVVTETGWHSMPENTGS